MAAKDELGRKGEQLAVQYLRARGMRILDRNWRCRHGEIDVVAQDGASLVVVEVKTRSGHTHGTALESVSRAKLVRLRALTARWLAAQPRPYDHVRIDVIALQRVGGDFTLRHVKGAI
jgi:putative endonuclease